MQHHKASTVPLSRPAGAGLSGDDLLQFRLGLLLTRRQSEVTRLAAADTPILGNQPGLPAGMRRLQPPVDEAA